MNMTAAGLQADMLISTALSVHIEENAVHTTRTMIGADTYY